MPRFSANISTLFTDSPPLERLKRAADAGFKAVEWLFPYAFDPKELANELQLNHLDLALINLPAGNWAAGDRGTAALPRRKEEFLSSLEQGLNYAHATGCKRVHLMAGIIPDDEDRASYIATYLDNLRLAADCGAELGITVLIEPLNSRDVPGYLLSRQLEAATLINEVDHPNLKLQLDYYHAQIMEGDLTKLTEQLLPIIGHVQIASVPDRTEPDEGEVAYEHVFRELDRLGYPGWVGCEYHPRGMTEDGLKWLDRFNRTTNLKNALHQNNMLQM